MVQKLKDNRIISGINRKIKTMPDNINITALHFTVTSVLLFRIKINKIQNQTNKYICVQRIYITLEVADFEVLT